MQNLGIIMIISDFADLKSKHTAPIFICIILISLWEAIKMVHKKQTEDWEM